MTIINAFVAQEHALIGCDTECRGDDGTIHQVAKMLPIVHMNSVLAVAGNLLYANKLLGLTHLAAADFDKLLGDMPKLLRLALQMTRTQGELSGVKFQKDPAGETVFLVGYSAKQARMIGRCWNDFAEREINCSVHPSFHTYDPHLLERLKALPMPDSPSAMARMAQEQAAIFREHPELFPTVHVGGKFIVAEIKREAMTIRPAGIL